ncbi:MAG: hypothetical protein ABSG46_19740, partial [Candidatus Binataceae bacterium]
QGFLGGVVFGGFLEYAMFGMTPLKSQRREEVKLRARVVLNLKFSNDTTITIEDPGCIPLIGEKVSFVDQHSREVVAREIRYEGSLGRVNASSWCHSARGMGVRLSVFMFFARSCCSKGLNRLETARRSELRGTRT